jgi:hypothetical protein
MNSFRGSYEITGLVDQVCIILARDTFESTLALGTYRRISLAFANTGKVKHSLYQILFLTILGGVTEEIRVVVGGGPIPVVLLFFQHLYQPLCRK